MAKQNTVTIHTDSSSGSDSRSTNTAKSVSSNPSSSNTSNTTNGSSGPLRSTKEMINSMDNTDGSQSLDTTPTISSGKSNTSNGSSVTSTHKNPYIISGKQIQNSANNLIKKIDTFGGNIKSEFVLISIACIIMIISSFGYSIKSKCESNDINPNVVLTVRGFMGIGTGIILYSFLWMLKLANGPIIIMLALLLITIGSINMYSYNKLSDECKATAELSADLSVGLIGTGIGMIIHLLAYNGINHIFSLNTTLNSGLNKFRYLTMVICVISIIVSSLVINMANSCSKIKEGESISAQKNGAVGGLVIFILVFIGILISFKYKKQQ